MLTRLMRERLRPCTSQVAVVVVLLAMRAVGNLYLPTTALKVNRIFALAMPALMAILNLSSVAVIWFGGRLVSEGTMPIGNLTAFLTYILQILISVMMAVMMVILIPRAMASAERIEDVLDAAPSVADPPQPVIPAAITGLVEFRGVTYRLYNSQFTEVMAEAV
jgi:ABC-type multidrug transport system fused ATPase/permease subunit